MDRLAEVCGEPEERNSTKSRQPGKAASSRLAVILGSLVRAAIERESRVQHAVLGGQRSSVEGDPQDIGLFRGRQADVLPALSSASHTLSAAEKPCRFLLRRRAIVLELELVDGHDSSLAAAAALVQLDASSSFMRNAVCEAVQCARHPPCCRRRVLGEQREVLVVFLSQNHGKP